MLSKEDNEFITRVGPGTPMGELWRRYWLPVMLSQELPEADCPPVKLRLLGEDLVAFRLTSGRIGVVQAYCPHRNANLFWGRNEEEGLRCVYHGWKFDIDGNCVDMPNEPATSNFASKIRQPAYQAVERGDVIWVYMGPRELAPEVPKLEWTVVPPENRFPSKRIQLCNWLQNLEGEVDSSHASFLHATLDENHKPARRDGLGRDLHPVFSVLETDYGVAIAARREAANDEYYWRVTPFMLPAYTIIPGTYGGNYTFTGAVPIDDENMIGITVTWSAEHAVPRTNFVEVDHKFMSVRNKDNDYQIDRDDQKTKTYTGIAGGARVQDLAVQEDQRGPISDRSTEHLGASDTGVIATRQRLIRQAKALQQGIEPREPHTPDAYYIRSMGVTAGKDIDWNDLMLTNMPVKDGPKAAAGKPAAM